MLFWALALFGVGVAWLIYETANAPTWPDDYGGD